jgi:hypothetical protein
VLTTGGRKERWGDYLVGDSAEITRGRRKREEEETSGEEQS